jgi:hypothetical protein
MERVRRRALAEPAHSHDSTSTFLPGDRLMLDTILLVLIVLLLLGILGALKMGFNEVISGLEALHKAVRPGPDTSASVGS